MATSGLSRVSRRHVWHGLGLARICGLHIVGKPGALAAAAYGRTAGRFLGKSWDRSHEMRDKERASSNLRLEVYLQIYHSSISMSTSADLKDHARELFDILVEAAGPEEWDWQAVANKAFDAVENFEIVANQRINPQEAVPADPVRWVSSVAPDEVPQPTAPAPDQPAAPAAPDQTQSQEQAAPAAPTAS
jgi:hypothetical protein